LVYLRAGIVVEPKGRWKAQIVNVDELVYKLEPGATVAGGCEGAVKRSCQNRNKHGKGELAGKDEWPAQM
jgi:hypothetical protein